MSTSQEFVELLQNAFFVSSNVVRQKAEAMLIQFKSQNPNDFFLQCSGIFTSTINSPQIRQAAATLLKRSILHENGWLSLQQENKQTIKNQLLSLLVSTESQIMKYSANCISSICAIELPRGEWNDIVMRLVQNISHEQIEIQKAAIITLGFICEALKNQKENTIPQSESEKVLFGICQGLSAEQKNQEIKLLAVKALHDSLTFMTHHLNQQQIRDFVTKVLLENAISQNEEIRICSLQCLIDYSKSIFDYLDQYIQSIQVCLNESLHSGQEIAVPAMEVWQVIASEVIERSTSSNRANVQTTKTQYDSLQSVHNQILQAVLQNLLKNQEDDDEEECILQEAAYKTASAIAEAVGQGCYPLFTVFIENTLNGNEWEKRKAALLAFAAMIEQQDSDILLGYSQNALTQFFTKFNDPNQRVVLAASRLIMKISENYPEAILLHQSVLQYVEVLFKLLNGKSQITKNAIWSITYLTDALKNSNSLLKQYSDNLIKQLAAVTSRQDLDQSDNQLISLAWVGILNLIHCVDNPDQIKLYLEEFGRQLKTVATQVNWRKESMSDGLLAAIHAGFLRLNEKNTPPTMEFVSFFYQIIIENFKINNSVSVDGIYAISAIAQYSKKLFSSLAGEFIQTYLQRALQQTQEPETFKSAVLCLADIARSLLEGFTPYLTIMDYLVQCINNQQINRDLKISLFVCITDIILATGLASEQYYPQVIQLIQSGFLVGIQLANQNDPQQQEYAENLNETLINSYMCMLHAYNSDRRPHLGLFETINSLVQFIQHTSDKRLTPTVDYIRACVSCLIDCVTYYKVVPGKQETILQLLNSPILCGLLELLKKYQNNQENLETLQYARDQYRSFNLQFSLS